MALREEPREILWQTELSEVRAARLVPEQTVGGDERLRLEMTRADGSRELLSARDPQELLDLLTRTRAGRLTPALPSTPAADEEPSLAQGHVWFQEPRRSGPLWRGGQARLTADRLVWRSPPDSGPALILPTADIVGVRRLPGYGPAGEGKVLAVATAADGETCLVADDPVAWEKRLNAQLPERRSGRRTSWARRDDRVIEPGRPRQPAAGTEGDGSLGGSANPASERPAR